MGDSGRYPLKKFRRGLYGTATIEGNYFAPYGDRWLMEIRVRQECRRPDRVASVRFLYKDKRFLNWLLSSKNLPISSAEEVVRKCFVSAGASSYLENIDAPFPTQRILNPEQLWGEGLPSKSEVQFVPDQKAAELPCESILDRFFNETKIAVVVDDVVHQSFYIRDRNCIAAIKTKAEDLVDVFANESHLWLNRCGYQNHNLWSLTEIMTQALSSDMNRVFDDATISKLSANANLLSGYQAGADVWWITLTKDSVRLYPKCRDAKKLDLYRKTVQSILKRYHDDIGLGYAGREKMRKSQTEKLESICSAQ